MELIPTAADGALPVAAMLMAFAGGLALFLHGMDGVTSGLKGLAGGSLSRLLARLSGNRVAGVATGVAVTATIQSSTVTMVLVIGFLSAGLLTLSQSVGVIIGANVGTTITAQIIAFDVVRYALGMIAVGVAAQFAGRREVVRQVGRALAGLGILFLGMGVMQEAMAPLRDHEPFLSLMAADRGPLPGVLIGAAATALIQSSSATLGIVIVMASQGLVPLETGIAIALGATIGTAVTTMLATIGRPPVAVRAGLIHVLFNGIGVGVALPLIPWIAEAAVAISPSTAGVTGTEALAEDSPRQIANAYTITKAAMLVGFLPFTRQLAGLVERLIPVREREARAAPKYLDEDVLSAPAVALELAHREVTRLGHRSLEQVQQAVPMVVTGTTGQLAELAERDDDIDELHNAIIGYLRQLDNAELTEAEGQRLLQLINVARYYEIVGDLVERELVRVGMRRLEEGVPISDQTLSLLSGFHTRMTELYAEAIEAFAQSDPDRARRVLDAKYEVGEMLDAAAHHHTARLGAEAPQRVAAFVRGTEMIEHLRRIYTYAKRVARSVPGVEDDSDDTDAEDSQHDVALKDDRAVADGQAVTDRDEPADGAGPKDAGDPDTGPQGTPP